MSIVYGPVSSWRLKKSLGVDLICKEETKACSFDCIYCSLGKTLGKKIDRKNFVDIDRVRDELKRALNEVDADYITFSGTGEPTLAENIGEGIKIASELSDLPIVVLTNSSLLYRDDVREELSMADMVIGSLDAPNEKLFKKINQPHRDLNLKKIIGGMKKFQNEFEGIFSLEIMFIPENKNFSSEIAEIVREINPDEVQANTPLRSCSAKPLDPEDIEKIKGNFQGMNLKSVYDAEKVEVEEVIGIEKLRKLKRPEEG